MYEHIKTLVEIAYYCKTEYGNTPFLKYKKDQKFADITFVEFVELMEKLAASLYHIGIRKGDKVGIVSDNHYKWIVSDMAILSIGGVDVPRGADTVPAELSYIMNHSDSTHCFVENPEQAEKIISILSEAPKLKHIILMNGELNEINNKPSGIKFYHFDELLENGKELKNEYHGELKDARESIKETDLVTIIYTSGTTGQPKGVMLLHKNIMHNVHNIFSVFDCFKQRWVTVLPVWHIYERTLEYFIMISGSFMAYSKPSPKQLLPDLLEIKPTFMASVPRIWEAVYNGIFATVKKGSALRKLIFAIFIKVGLIYSNAVRVLTGQEAFFKKETFFTTFRKKFSALFKISFLFLLNILGDLLVFKKIREKTGGELKTSISGGGALPEYIDRFFSAIKLNIFEGYGLTETSPIVSVRNFKRRTFKTVGKPLPFVEIMIGDNEWNPRTSFQKKGVVYVKGDLVMAGYYKDPERTASVIKNGWFNTGDLGRLTLAGEIQLTGRAKDTIVLTGGENVEPEPIENKLYELPLIYQAIVVGQDRKNLGALIVPARENLEEYAKRNQIKYKTYEELLTEKRIIDEYQKIIKQKVNMQNGFRDFERINNFLLLPNPFEVGKELTSSLKMKRNYIMEKYRKEIDSLYGIN